MIRQCDHKNGQPGLLGNSLNLENSWNLLEDITVLSKITIIMIKNTFLSCQGVFNVLINTLLTHPGPSRGKLGGSYHGPGDV